MNTAFSYYINMKTAFLYFVIKIASFLVKYCFVLQAILKNYKDEIISKHLKTISEIFVEHPSGFQRLPVGTYLCTNTVMKIHHYEQEIILFPNYCYILFLSF